MARDDDWLMSALAAQDAYRGDADFPPPPPALLPPPSPPSPPPVSLLRTGALPRTFDEYLAAATRPRPREAARSEYNTLPRQLAAGALRGAMPTIGRAPSPFVGELDPDLEDQMRGAAEQAIREVPEPTTPAGRYTRAFGESLVNPTHYMGVGPLAGLGWAAASAIGGETLGHEFKGTKAEPWARAIGSAAPLPAWWLAGKGLEAMPTNALGALGGRGGGRGGRPLPPRSEEDLAPNPRAVMGGNMPPEGMALAREPLPPSPPPAMGSLAEPPPLPPPPPSPPPAMGAIADQSWAAGLPRPRPARQSTDIPSIRGLPVEEGIEIARRQPHLIPAGERSEGYYVGGPRNIQSKRDLNKQRAAYDAAVLADPRGWDWYERYRPALNLSTGGIPAQNQFAGAQHGQWSAGVDPASELHYVLKELNSSIAGMPERANYGAQHRAHLAAIAANDPSMYQLADKTEEYANQITRGLPGGKPLVPGATGVVDFRNLREWGYTEKSGEPQKGAPGAAAHRFVDMETALAIDRANKRAAGGKTDWTGEQLQAAPWVRQKALDLMSRNQNLTYEQAFNRANRTIADFYPFKTYNATYEAQPGADVKGHMPGSVAADAAAREAYFGERGSSWATAPMGRDAIYAGLMSQNAPGNAMRVLPTVPMTGMYRTPAGVLETNPGEVAQPMGTFRAPRDYEKEFIGPRDWEPFKRATDADRATMTAGEYFRAWLDAQNAGSWHKFWEGGPQNQSTSLLYPKVENRRAPIADLLAQQAVGAKHGLGDVTDSARGTLLTRFWPPVEGRGAVPQLDDVKEFNRAFRKGELDVPGMAGPPVRVRVDSELANLVDEWQKGEGSGAATRKMLEHVTATPELRSAFNDNPYLAEQALAKFERDKAWAGRWGAPRQDIQNARQVVAGGKGWVDRIEAALKDGSISLPAATALLAGAAAMQREGASREGL
jgi:hypothetical protein